MSIRSAWAAAHTPVAGVPRWARIAAVVVPLTVVPSSLWRISGWTLHLPIVYGGPAVFAGQDRTLGMPTSVYVVLLSVFSEVVAFAAVGLVARWGEVFPRWIPALRGRRVPPLAAIVPAAAGAALLTVIWTAALLTVPFSRTITGRPMTVPDPLTLHHWKGILAVAMYLPLVVWGPLLGALTVAYWRRRRAGSHAG
ncbi:hypothetical protein AB0H43_25815 [Hamadaea sp. NPDC050747]|uniref:hypothetical protein n=1 Tax=Hamadaea sp. NPDC050747 TaxID=3155789 RepID=UPI003409B56F